MLLQRDLPAPAGADGLQRRRLLLGRRSLHRPGCVRRRRHHTLSGSGRRRRLHRDVQRAGRRLQRPGPGGHAVHRRRRLQRHGLLHRRRRVPALGVDPCEGGAECADHCNADGTCFTPVGTPCTDDGNPCTVDSCDGQGDVRVRARPCRPGVWPRLPVSRGANLRRTERDMSPGHTPRRELRRFPIAIPTAPSARTATASACRRSRRAAATARSTTASSAGNRACRTVPAAAAAVSRARAPQCRAAGGHCDLAETCNGFSAECPADSPKPANTPCNDGNFCNGADACTADGVCAPSGIDPCAGGAECSNTCNADGTCFTPVGAPCTNDGNPCTAGQCDGQGKCASEARQCRRTVYAGGLRSEPFRVPGRRLHLPAGPAGGLRQRRDRPRRDMRRAGIAQR